MRRGWIRRLLGLVGLAAAGLSGCHNNNTVIPPARPVEEYIIPPEDDPRWSKPLNYPENVLNRPLQKREFQPGLSSTPGGPPSVNSGPGRMGGGMGPSSPY